MNAEGSASQDLLIPTDVVDPAKPQTQQERDIPSIDISSTICVLHPASETARLDVQHLLDKASPNVFVKASGIKQLPKDSPQSLNYKLQPDFDFNHRLSSRNDVGDYVIILDLSIKPKNPAAGFTFGRSSRRCDVALVNDPHRRISNVHFSIYVDEDGTAMIEDHSTNGTVVDSQLLGWDIPAEGRSDPVVTKWTLDSGMIITVLLNDEASDLKFRVQIPDRNEIQKDLYAQNVKNFFIQHNIKRQSETSTSRSSDDDSLYISKLKQQSSLQSEVDASESVQSTIMCDRQWDDSGKYLVKEVVRKGASTTVYKVVSRFDGRLYAAKEIQKRRFMRNGILDQRFYNETQILKQIHHPNLVEYIEHIECSEGLQIIIMENIAGSSLDNIISSGVILGEEVVRSISRQLLSAMSYLQDKRIVHRDIKPDNVILKSLDPVEVKIIDFGLSTMMTDDAFLHTFCGTLLYCAPEIYSEYAEYDESGVRSRKTMQLKPNRQGYSYPVDIWSLGGTLFYTMTGSPPYSVKGGTSYTELLHRIMTTDLDILPLRRKDVSEQAIKFLSRMLCNRPEARATVTELQSHPWLGASRSATRIEAQASVPENMDFENSTGTSSPSTSPAGSCIDVGFNSDVSVPLKKTSKHEVLSSAYGPNSLSGVSSRSASLPREEDIEQESNFGMSTIGGSKGISEPAPKAHHPESKRHDAHASQAGESSKLDSGFASCESAGYVQDHDTDNESIYSVDYVLPASTNGFIEEFSVHLANDIQNLALETQLPGIIDELLSSLLKTFAWKLHGESSSRSPARSNKSSNTRDDIDGEILQKSFSMPASEVRNWVSALEGVTEMDIDEPDVHENDSTSEDMFRSPPNLDDYKQFIESSQAYQWLLLRIKRYSQMDRSGLSLMLDIGLSIRNHLLSFAPLRKVSRHKAPISVEMSFSLDWNLRQFIQDQEYTGAPEDIFDCIICLTGTSQQAQAMTVSEYMEQTWPAANESIRLLMKKYFSYPNEDGWIDPATERRSIQLKYPGILSNQLLYKAGRLNQLNLDRLLLGKPVPKPYSGHGIPHGSQNGP
ncbi:hypothetical protein G7Z17_g1593 [Cylindrodendrum hubeiense]|uniref:Autophagy-related protein 1 n=1 Tax=Cylindrodendrum hubeiense TaxID=595255 RepID=A0A9P5HI18_9HYPO|nr:hypothetical protein G7Z17_g1593 [Cylindrodendrum hubeiense]